MSPQMPLCANIYICNPVSPDAPVCRGPPLTVSAVEGEAVQLLCDVTANPDKVRFVWTFNNTVDSTVFERDKVGIKINFIKLT